MSRSQTTTTTTAVVISGRCSSTGSPAAKISAATNPPNKKSQFVHFKPQYPRLKMDELGLFVRPTIEKAWRRGNANNPNIPADLLNEPQKKYATGPKADGVDPNHPLPPADITQFPFHHGARPANTKNFFG